MNDLHKRTFDDCFITPDYVRKKINSDRPFSPVVVDALSFMAHSVPLQELLDVMKRYLDPFSIELKSGFMGFTRGKMTETGHSVISYSPSDALIRCGRYYSSDVCYVTITGHDCAYLNSKASMPSFLSALTALGERFPLVYTDPKTGEQVTSLGIQFKRIDLAKDCFDARFNFLLKYENPSFIISSKNKEGRWARSFQRSGFCPGWTLYFGTREKSSCFVRLYDKRVEQGLHKPEAIKALGFDLTDWVRLEFEVKGKLAQSVVSDLVLSPAFNVKIQETYEILAKDYFALKDKDSLSNRSLSQRPLHPLFAEFIAKDEFCDEFLY